MHCHVIPTLIHWAHVFASTEVDTRHSSPGELRFQMHRIPPQAAMHMGAVSLKKLGLRCLRQSGTTPDHCNKHKEHRTSQNKTHRSCSTLVTLSPFRAMPRPFSKTRVVNSVATGRNSRLASWHNLKGPGPTLCYCSSNTCHPHLCLLCRCLRSQVHQFVLEVLIGSWLPWS